MNVWHIATYSGKLDVMQWLWVLAKERLTTEEIKNEILLGTDREGRNVWQLPAYSGN